MWRLGAGRRDPAVRLRPSRALPVRRPWRSVGVRSSGRSRDCGCEGSRGGSAPTGLWVFSVSSTSIAVIGSPWASMRTRSGRCSGPSVAAVRPHDRRRERLCCRSFRRSVLAVAQQCLIDGERGLEQRGERGGGDRVWEEREADPRWRQSLQVGPPQPVGCRGQEPGVVVQQPVAANEFELDELVQPAMGGGATDREPRHHVLGLDCAAASDPPYDFSVTRGQHRRRPIATAMGERFGLSWRRPAWGRSRRPPPLRAS